MILIIVSTVVGQTLLISQQCWNTQKRSIKTMPISNKELAKMVCVVCAERLGDHSKRDIIRCMFRLQGSVVSAKINEEKVKDV